MDINSLSSILFDEVAYIAFFAVIMLTFSLIKRYDVFLPIYRFIVDHVRSKRAVVALLSCVGGIAPIEGRIVLGAGLLDTLAPKEKSKRGVFGIVDYLSAHHYYFWSPLEQTVILPLAILHISYLSFMGLVLPLLVTVLCFVFIYIFLFLKENDIEINVDRLNTINEPKEKLTIFNIIRWDILLFATILIILGNFLGMFHEQIVQLIEANHLNIIIGAIACVGASFLLGSSSKYVALAVVFSSVFTIHYFPLFFALGYAGYMLSPVHKCTYIAQSYFGTSPKKFYSTVGLLSSLVILAGLLTTLVSFIY